MHQDCRFVGLLQYSLRRRNSLERENVYVVQFDGMEAMREWRRVQSPERMWFATSRMLPKQ